MNQRKILIVQESDAASRLLARVLTEKKYNVVGIAKSSEQAIEITRDEHPDLAFIGIKSAGEFDGIKTAMILSSSVEMPVIFLAGKADLKFLDRIKEAFPYSYLKTPFNISELLFSIDSLLYKHRMIMKAKDSEERLNAIWNNIQAAIVIIDEDSDIIININPKASEIIGLSSENIIGRDRKDFFLDGRETGNQDGSGSDYFVIKETILLNGKNEKVPIYKSIKRIRFREKSYLLNSFFDITGKKKHEIEIMNARDEIQSLLSSLVTILIGVSIDDEVTHWNKIAENTFGIPAFHVLGVPLTQCNIKWDWPVIYEGIYQCISDDRQVRLTDLTFTNRENRSGFLDITINPIKDKDANFKGFMLTGEDVTLRKDLERQLAHAQKMESIGKLSAGIAHEINTPTQYITDNIYFLQDSFSKLLEILNTYKELVNAVISESEARDVLTKINKIIKRNDLDFISHEIPNAISQAIDGLSKVAKIVRSMKNFVYPASNTKTYIDINNAVEDTINISRNEWKYYSDIVTHFDKNLLSVPCFPGELNQVFLNIIINAADAIKEKNGGSQSRKGIIEISTGIEGKWAVITIKDSGTGIPRDIIDKIFDPFFTTKEVGKGTGQGLAIAYDIIVNKHNGTINYISEEGAGATCVIKIPRI